MLMKKRRILHSNFPGFDLSLSPSLRLSLPSSMASSQWLAPLSPLPLPPSLTPTPTQLKGTEEEEEEEAVAKRGLRGREREVQTEERKGARKDPTEKKQPQVEEKEVEEVSPLCPSQARHPAPRLPSLWPSRV